MDPAAQIALEACWARHVGVWFWPVVFCWSLAASWCTSGSSMVILGVGAVRLGKIDQGWFHIQYPPRIDRRALVLMSRYQV